MDVDQVAEGLWRWTARHPDWSPGSSWESEVGCVYYEAPDAVLLVDPLVPGEPDERERFWRALDRDLEAAGRPLAVVLTVYWHERSAQGVLDRYDGATLWANEAARGRLSASVTNPFRPGDPLPGGAEAIETARGDEVVVWLPAHRALVVGDVLLGDETGGLRVCPDSWLPEGVPPEELRTGLSRLLELPVERVLVSHGEPVLAGGREALAAALA